MAPNLTEDALGGSPLNKKPALRNIQTKPSSVCLDILRDTCNHGSEQNGTSFAELSGRQATIRHMSLTPPSNSAILTETS